MDTAEIFVLLTGAALIAFILWFFFGKSDEAAANVSAEGLPIYECPMHPWITSTNPADNCSICGMKLVRRGEAESKSTASHHGHE